MPDNADAPLPLSGYRCILERMVCPTALGLSCKNQEKPSFRKPSIVADSQFIGYWERRAHLDPADWHAFYQLTHRFLAACPVRSFAAELGERKVLIDDFFHDKIFMSAGSDCAGARLTTGALCQYFRRYLVDRTRNAWDAHRVSDEEAGTAYEGCAFTRVDDIDKILADGGLDIESVVAAARDFLAAQEEAERLYLALHTCADEAEALSGLAERHRIASYH